MSVSVAPQMLTVALIGNPNTGKSTLFSALCGVRQRVGNYPGVTVEKKTGRTNIDGQAYELVDLPGTYSLAPRSPDEMIAVDVLLGRLDDLPAPDVVVCILDASNLERNLYLVSQVLDLDLPTIVVLNMADLARRKGVTIDVDRLSEQLGVPVVSTCAHRSEGTDQLRQTLAATVGAEVGHRASPLPAAVVRQVELLEQAIGEATDYPPPDYLVERLLLDVGGYVEQLALPGVTPVVRSEVHQARQRLAEAGMPVPGVEAVARYDWIAKVLDGALTRREVEQESTLNDRLDQLLTHRVWGTLAFLALMVVIFQAIFRWAVPLMEWVELGTEFVARLASSVIPAGTLQSLVVDGVIAGVGGIIIFLPQIVVLFLFIAVLEDCGYMARAAFLMDKLMSRIGLSGKSFIPLLSSFACAIPGIMAARVIENRRDRLITILVAPLMTCSARLPVYMLLIGVLIPDRRYLGGWLGLQGLTLLSMYLLGILAAVVMALLLRRTVLQGQTPPFVMELPSYKLPSVRVVGHRVLERGWAFVRRAGTVILATSVVVWALAYFPRAQAPVGATASAETAAGVSAAEQIRQSYLGRAGQFVEPVVRPLGWDWRIGCATLASFPARELIVSTLGVIFELGDDQDEESHLLRDQVRRATWEGGERPLFTIPVALSIMVFFALCAQCAATLAVIRRETNSWRWPLFTFAYMTLLAYVGALITFQVSVRLIG